MDRIVPKNVFSTERKSYLSKKKLNKLEIIKKCSKCASVIQKGKSHICKKSVIVNNIKESLKNMELKTKEQLTSSLLKDVTKIKGESESVKLSKAQGGKPLRVSIGSVKNPKETLLTIDNFQNIRTTFNLSYKVTSGIETAIRVATKNAKIIEPNLKRKLLDKNHILDDLFDCKDVSFKRVINKDISVTSETLIYCTNLEKLIEHITESRNITSNHLKFGIDGGGGFLKVCLSIQSTSENNLNEN